jgi:hypothetical protein
VFPAEGAPLVFAAQVAHDLVLHVEPRAGSGESAVDVPLKAESAKGGLVFVNPTPQLPKGDLSGVVRGKWGFDDWEGPRFGLRAAQPGKWTLADGDQSALVVGREDTLHFEGDSTLCVERVEQLRAGGDTLRLTWKSPKPELLEVGVPMKNASPGPVTLQISQFGLREPDKLVLQAYAEAASLDRLTLNAGDTVAQLRGTRLDEVAKAELEGIALTPGHLGRVQGADQLSLNAGSSTANLDPTKPYFARIQLRDGRVLKTPATVAPPRPQVSLLSKGAQDDSGGAPSPVKLGSPDDLPVGGRLVFFLKSNVPASFPRDEKVEVAAGDGSFRTVLTLADGSLMLEDAKTAMGSVEPLARFGSSAFGPLQVRVLSADGTAGDWQPLGTLVRVPGFRELRCPHVLAKPCALTGTNLFLVASIAATSDFGNAIDVPPDFTGTQLSVPHAANGILYLKLRDDPATVQTLTLPVTVMGQPESKAIAPQSQPPAAQMTEPSVPVTAPSAIAPEAQPTTAPPTVPATKPQV